MTQRPSFPARLDFQSGKPTGKTVDSKGAGPGVKPPNAPLPTPSGAVASKNTTGIAIKKVAAPAISTASAALNASKNGLKGSGGNNSGNGANATATANAAVALRARMVHKLAAQGITSPQVLSAIGAIERHRFVDTALAEQAYEDTSLPIGLGQTISKPSVVARMVELLLGGQKDPSAKLGRVLDIGTGCGYQAAVLSRVASEVYSIERLRGLHDKARDNLRPFRLPNVHLLFGDGMVGFAKGGPYAGIIAAAGGEALPQAWIDQLAVGGRIVAPMVTSNGQQALMVVEKTPGGLKQSVLEGVHFVPLKSGVA